MIKWLEKEVLEISVLGLLLKVPLNISKTFKLDNEWMDFLCKLEYSMEKESGSLIGTKQEGMLLTVTDIYHECLWHLCVCMST